MVHLLLFLEHVHLFISQFVLQTQYVLLLNVKHKIISRRKFIMFSLLFH